MNDVALIRSVMEKPDHIRNVFLIGHVDQGKSTLTDFLNSTNACLVPSSDQIQNDNNSNIIQNIAVGRTAISPLFYKLPADSSFPNNADGPDFLINLAGGPSNVDFSAETEAYSCISDGVLVLVDAVEGTGYQTEKLLRQTLLQRIVPILAINKLDRTFLELQLSSEDLYQYLIRMIENVNVAIATYEDQALGDISIHPEKSNVAFISALGGWGFTLKQFGGMYADRFGVDEEKMVQRLWGDNFFDPEIKKWKTTPTSDSGKKLSRAFCKFILDPIQQVMTVVMNGDREKLQNILKVLKIKLTSDESECSGKRLLKVILNKWLPLNASVLEMMVNHLPSPAQAQKYRVDHLYTGPLDDVTAEAIKRCDAKGPLTVYVCRMVPTSDHGRFYALGRVFSGTISAGQTIRIMGPDHRRGWKSFYQCKKEDVYVKPVKETMLVGYRSVVFVESVGAGNFCLLSGIDQYILKTATLASDETSFPFATALIHAPKPPMRYSVEPENPADLPKLVEGLKYLQKYELLLKVHFEDTGELVITGDSELLIEVSIRDIEERSMKGGKIKISEPWIEYKETVISESSQINWVASPNKHNRLVTAAMPLQEGLPEAIENLEITPSKQPGLSKLVQTFDWKEKDVQELWCFGEPESPANILVNTAPGVVNISEIKDSTITAFHWVTKEGVLANERVRGVRINIMDVVLHADAVHRGGGQIIPTARRSFYASMLTAQPRLMEPIFLVEIQCTQSALAGVYSTMNQRKGIVVEEIPRPGTLLTTVKGYLPVEESHGFAAALRASTSGQAFPQWVLDHYQVIPDDPLVPGTRSNEIVQNIRKRRGLSQDVPNLSNFL